MTNHPSQTPEIQAYLDRIGFQGKLDNGADTLAELQHCHIYSVPYENLDILNGVPLSLDIRDLYDKIVVRRRGGYCFELNALFGWLLGELGFPVTHYFARFWRDEDNLPPKRRHHVLQVEAEGARYLCDVGVGGNVPGRPVLIKEHLEQPQGTECYRLDRDSFFGWQLMERKGEDWRLIYSFAEEPQLPRDYVMASFWCEHAPESIFRQGPMVFIRTSEGRNTVAGDEFRIFAGKEVRILTPRTPEEKRDAFRQYFGIVLPE
ncbi:arylamine N-acetyltransferase family protein [Paenibacillus cineris]|uniref:Acetyltransferase n=1 Tax=Paenibacillus cineris TaxID=237530 RepID=A0ABQ4LB24_9BACL|nr:arylamine N-acetyltransferase [Paenibacillus cineris]GIO53628.1 hypothetical protein J21TS7_19460 [Paenibacillus cineris]GIO60703.1 hypothetical protein J43TS9_22770 [Paenibacillus cineris]